MINSFLQYHVNKGAGKVDIHADAVFFVSFGWEGLKPIPDSHTSVELNSSS